ncbi:platelet glycoprotein Ib alpha chain [Alosa sapidissima]|uniref:platelet glycoprotein Ib alpha chain n=1 Tax=Alosa sapidissima TaxID=34773 RepID=UPI001C092DBB|nr:platelet glycoprotein Ib alpha chain [Alosa sapidissima]
MRILLVTLLFLPSLMAYSCHSDRNKDHRPRVSCLGKSLSSIPAAIDRSTEVLVLSQNLFKTLKWVAYVGFPGLHELDLRHNHISTLESSGTVLGNLSVLQLSNNLLVGVGERAFVSAPQLRELFLRENRLCSLHASSFSGLPILEVLDLSRNQLTTLPPDLLTQISSTTLKTLDLEDNRILLMPHNWFSSKPELPYVFLSKNPWRCFCDVGYLQIYLDDQAHNVYFHTNPQSTNPLQDIENNAESVVCASPPSLAKRPIIDLTEEDYCDSALLSEATAPPVRFGDVDRLDIDKDAMDMSSTAQTTTIVDPKTNIFTATKTSTTLSTIEIRTTRSPTTTTSTTLTTVDLRTTRSPTTTTSTTQTASAVDLRTTRSPTTTTSTTQTASTVDLRTTMSPTTMTPATPSTAVKHPITTPFSVLASTLRGRIMIWTRRWMVSWTESWTVQHAWSEFSPLTYPELTTPNWPSTLPPDPSTTSVVLTTTTRASTTDPTTTLPSTPASTTTSAIHSIFAGSHGERAGAIIWCTWLFAGLLLLCLLSALSSCLLGLGLAWAYLTLYRPLSKKVANVANGQAQVRPLDYRTKAGSDGLSGYGIAHAPVDASGGVQATFRSVLFIAKGSEGKEVEEKEKGNKKEGDDNEKEKDHREGERDGGAAVARTQLGITDVGTGVAVVKCRNHEREAIRGSEGKEVFRKTLYRVFSREEEIEGWREVEEHWEERQVVKDGGGGGDNRKSISVMGGVGVERKTRYSLVLREEKVEGGHGTQERGMEWLVGEWEMGGIGEGMSERQWASLISGMGEEGPLVTALSPKEDI